MLDCGTMQTARADVVSIFASLPKPKPVLEVQTLADEIVPQLKRCWRCHQDKAVDGFVKNAKAKDGCASICKQCSREYGRERHSQNSERKIYRCMIQRCYNPKDISYSKYGGRGIIVCPEWLGEGGRERFLAYIGKRPSLSHSIDRYPNPDGNYEPGNVRWATWEEQNNNRGSFNTRLAFHGETKTIAEWSLVTGFSINVICARLYNSRWSVERTLTEPLAGSRGPYPKIAFNGKCLTAKSWARELKIPYSTFRQKVQRAGSVEAVLAAYVGGVLL